jgi:hypothetical protein
MINLSPVHNAHEERFGRLNRFVEEVDYLLITGFLLKIAEKGPTIENLCGGQFSPPLA